MLRILIALLTLCLALPAAFPAAAQVHGGHAMAMSDSHHAMPASHHDQSDHAAKHKCIGCAAAVDRSPQLEPRLALRSIPVLPGLASALPEARAGPETPPPRA